MLSALGKLFDSWMRSGPKRLERAAATKDAKALLEAAPQIISSETSLRNVAAARSLLALAIDLHRFLRRDVLPLLDDGSLVESVVAPYSAGMMANSSATKLVPHMINSIGLGTFNPGRSGLAQLGTDALLHWRLWAIAAAMQENGIHILALPSPRLPPGALLPEGFPMSWLGTRSVSWDTTGFLVDSDILDNVIVLEEFCSDRIFWLRIQASSAASSSDVVCCSYYCATGGDVQTWTTLLGDYALLSRKFPRANFFLLGDGNIHLSYLVDHPARCGCLHCKQPPNDVRIEHMIGQAGLRAINPLAPTHVSGTAIDLILVPRSVAMPARVLSERIGASDHHLVTCSCKISLSCFYNNAIGRVSWQAGEVWDEALESIAPALEALSVAIQEVLQSTDMRSPLLGGGVSKKLRRAVLDSAAWSRDLLVVLVGHFHGAVRVKSNMLKCRDSLSLSPSNFTSDAAFKAAVKEAALREQNRAANTYSFLRQKDRAQSERFLSSFFNKASEFQIALLDESSGEPLSHEAMLDLLVEDMMSRASNDFPADARSLQETDLLVSDVRSRGGFDLHNDSWSEPIQDSFYTLEELDDVLQKCHSSKKCLHGCFSLLKSSQSSHRKVVLGLANLSRHIGLTSTLWSLRQFAHIRKSGAKIVRKVQCLRPISLVADMAHVIDGLWLARNRSKLESFAGPNQVGGVSATNLLLLAILLLAQARDYQGLPLYLAILDLRWAFDVARLSSMKLACFQAGVRGTDWLLLDDVLDSDRQYVQLHGFLSHVFRLGCGIAQGRRFSVHVFNSLLSWLRDEIQQVTAANTSAWLPKYAIRALAHVDLEASHVDFYSRPSPVDALEPCVSRLQELMANAPTQASAELQTMINSLGSYADKCALLDAIGSFSLGPLQYVDDATVPCSSPGAVRAIVNKGGASAYSRYAARTKAQFNYGKNKTCAMALLNSPPLDHEALDCDVVDQKHILGVLFDSQLTFLPLLSQSLARGWSMFVDLFHTAETGIKENSVNTLYSHSVVGIYVWEAVCFLKSL
ncbi:MOCOS [Symbiodinium natans]|uniref:MOCOS protein n=1 Tax=Symbiodinium natans TaxID=878477 RepID=A0A812KE16_9DINO|nr:MOCOS [Symbiodinium natans]